MVIVPYKRREILGYSSRPSEILFFLIQSVESWKHIKNARITTDKHIVCFIYILICHIVTYQCVFNLLKNLLFHNSNNLNGSYNRSHARISQCAAIARMIRSHCARLSPTTPYCAASSPSEDLSASRKTPADNPSAFSARFHGNNSHTSATCVAI